jgi:signal transduction histidine kinase
MRENRVTLLLFLTILVMAAAPLLAGAFLLDRTLATSLNLGFNPHIVAVLDHASHNLKSLGALDAANRETYRQQFTEVENLRQVYANPALVRTGIENSLEIFFGVGLIAAVALSVAVAALLSRRIAASYRNTFAELLQQREKVRYLREISSWQELAKMLAHEIKNPLTPIEVLITSLTRAYLQKGEPEFREQLAQTQSMITEELNHLKSTVNRFGEFARLPQVQTSEHDLDALLRQHLDALAATFDSAELRLDASSGEARALIDPVLFRQVLANIFRNGIEANPDRRVTFSLRLEAAANELRLTVANDGVPVAPAIAPRLFDPYVSSKSGKDNMGLGLAIAKKIVIEHGGDIAYVEEQDHPAFVISLPGLRR